MTLTPDRQSDDTPMRCLGCGYQLKHLPENRCPECGRTFDPDDDKTYVGKLVDGWKYLLAAVGAGLAMFAPLVVVLLNERRPFGSPSILGNLGFLVVLGPIGMIGGCILAVSIAKASWEDLREPYCDGSRRRYLIAALVVSLAAIALMGFLVLFPSVIVV